MYSTPNLRIYVPKGEGNYLIQRFMEHPEFGYSQATGEFIELDRKTMRERGAEIVSKLLEEYPQQRDLGLPPETRMSAVEKRRFHKRHLTVVADLTTKDKLQLTPIDVNDTGTSGCGRDEQTVTIAVPLTAQQFIDGLNAVLRPEQAQTSWEKDNSERDRFIEQLLSRILPEKLPVTLVGLYVPRDGSEYVLQRMTEKPNLGNRATNEFLRLSRADLEANGAKVITDLMMAYPDRGPLPFKEMSQEAVEKLREYVYVGLSLLPDLKLRFDLLGDYREDDFVAIPVPFTPQQLIEALDAAVRQA